MDKKVFFIIFIIILIISFMFIKQDKKENMLADNIVIVEEEIEEKTIETSIREEKTTPNTILVLKKEYTDCGHEIINKSTIPIEMVNLTKNEIIKYYPNWDMESFSKNEIILSRKISSFCGEHYLIKEENEYIIIYLVDEENGISVYKNTEISVKYLTETDKINLKNGIMVYGNENLNKLLEDFET